MYRGRPKETVDHADQTSVEGHIAGNIILCIFCTRQFIVLVLLRYYTRIGIGTSSLERSLGNKNTGKKKKKTMSPASLFAFFFHVSRHSVGVYAYIIIIIILIRDDNIYIIPTLKHTRARTTESKIRDCLSLVLQYTPPPPHNLCRPVFRLNSVFFRVK